MASKYDKQKEEEEYGKPKAWVKVVALMGAFLMTLTLMSGFLGSAFQ